MATDLVHMLVLAAEKHTSYPMLAQLHSSIEANSLPVQVEHLYRILGAHLPGEANIELRLVKRAVENYADATAPAGAVAADERTSNFDQYSELLASIRRHNGWHDTDR